jgi:hypothetical protein
LYITQPDRVIPAPETGPASSSPAAVGASRFSAGITLDNFRIDTMISGAALHLWHSVWGKIYPIVGGQ